MSSTVTNKIDNLSDQTCSNQTSENPALNDEQASDYVHQLTPQWHLDTKAKNISHTFDFKNYYQTMAFVNVVAQIAHQQDHHPDLQVSYNRCAVTYSTHSVGGLSLNDFICAAKINAALTL